MTSRRSEPLAVAPPSSPGHAVRPSHKSSVFPSAATATRTGDVANRHASPSSASSVRSGRWWNSSTYQAPARLPGHRVVGCGMAARGLCRRLLCPAAGHRGQHVCPVASSTASAWYSPESEDDHVVAAPTARRHAGPDRRSRQGRQPRSNDKLRHPLVASRILPRALGQR